jgi:hypothetical protein
MRVRDAGSDFPQRDSMSLVPQALSSLVIPAQAGILFCGTASWLPACAGMTSESEPG